MVVVVASYTVLFCFQWYWYIEDKLIKEEDYPKFSMFDHFLSRVVKH